MYLVPSSEYVNAVHFQSDTLLEAFVQARPHHALFQAVERLVLRDLGQFLNRQYPSCLKPKDEKLECFLQNVTVVDGSIPEASFTLSLTPKVVNVFQRLLAVSQLDDLWQTSTFGVDASFVETDILKSKKRRFTGNRYTIRATINENDETSELNSTESASAKKLESSHTSLEIFSERLFETSKDNRIVSWTTLISFFAIVCCPDCYSQGLELIEDSVSGLCSHMNLKCKTAPFKGFPTTEKMKGSCLINSSIVLGLRIIGKGFSAGKKLCAFLGLPFLSKLAFRNQERKLLKATERVAQENINAALSEIKGSNSFTKCGISIDGTWQRRGYSSLNGCCPEGSESWCRYQRAKAAGSPLKEIEQGLPNKIINQIKPTYLKLCNETLLKKCLHGKTQNCNESYNNILWNIVPKNIFIGLETFRLGALLALILYNSGYAGILSVIRNVNGSLPESVAQELLKFDKQRISTSLRHSLLIAKLSR
ncbi:CCHC-type domain-containing protein [Trichonephila clavipes]|nr:CCHC-type domain-containing protein [Trichonephila clavipes]